MANPYLVPATVRCSAPGCQHIKGENNHWFTVVPESPESTYLFSVCGGVQNVFNFKEPCFPACGEACLLKVISELLKKEQNAHVDQAIEEER